jgi:hypothetical protein
VRRPATAYRRVPLAGRRAESGRWTSLPYRACLLVFSCILCQIVLNPLPAKAQRRQKPLIDFGLERVFGEAAASVRYDAESRKSTGRSKTDLDEILVQQELTLGGKGWIYHPAFLDVNTKFGVLFSQDFVKSGQGNSTDSTLNQFNYDVRLGILPYKSYPMSLFASQLRTQINSPFTERRDVDTLRYGAGITLQQLAVGEYELPTRMLYRHQETETSSFAGQGNNKRDRDEAEFVMNNKTDRTRNRFRYNFKSISSRSSGVNTSSTRHDVRAFQQRRLDRGNLSSQFFLVQNDRSFDTTSLSLIENLNLIHEHSLSSSYSYRFTHQDTGGFSQNSHGGTAGIAHQLYESLSSSAQLNSTYADSDLGDTWTAGGGGQLNYRKTIPGGWFGLRFAPNYLYTKEDTKSGIATVDNERHDVVVGIDIILDRSFILDSTIEVIDPDTNFLFTEGIDYNVISLGINTAIQVIPGSELDPAVVPQDTPVMAVSYDFRLEPGLTFSTVALASGLSLNLWEHYSGDVSYARTDQHLIDGIEEQTRLDDSRRLLARLEANFAHSRTRFEYERFKSSINPRERYTVTQDFNYRPGRRTSLGFGAAYDHDRIEDPNRTSETISSTLNLTTVLPFEILTRVNALFRWIDQEEQRSISAGPSISLTYHYGRLRFQLTDRLTWRRTESTFGSNQTTREWLNTVFFRIERPF